MPDRTGLRPGRLRSATTHTVGATALVVLLGSVAGCGAANRDDRGAGLTPDQLAEFSRVVDTARQAETQWAGPTSTPAPPSDVTLAVVSCAGFLEGCNRQVDGVKAASADLGWTVDVYDGKGDPVTQNQALVQAVNSGADAVLLAATDPRQVAGGMELAEQRRVPVGSMGLFIGAAHGVAFDVSTDFAAAGRAMASWVIDDSAGTATVITLNDEEFPSTDAQIRSANKTIEACTACVLSSEEQHVAADIGNGLGQRVASMLQRDPSVDYLIASYDAAITDIVPALQSSGLQDRAKMIGYIGNKQNLELVASGDSPQAATVAEDDQYLAYAAVDQMIRVLNGEEPWADPLASNDETRFSQAAPFRLFDETNIHELDGAWIAENDYVNTYRTPWGVR